MIFWQAALSGATPHAASGDFTLMSWPPTSSFSLSQLAASGHDGSEGRTRRVAVLGDVLDAACSDTGTIGESVRAAAAHRNKLRLFIGIHWPRVRPPISPNRRAATGDVRCHRRCAR